MNNFNISIKKLLIIFSASIITAIQAFSQARNESTGVERYAVFVGSNSGGSSHQRLMYAGTDAIAFQKTMSEIGGIPKSNGILLLDPTKDDLDDAMETISRKINMNSSRTKRSEFLFYYSGHSDENSLLLGKNSYGYSELKAAITSVPSDVHVVILDSCYSGNFIRTKGGQKKKPFLMDDSAVVKGHAYLSSSSSQEFSQESDEIGSSFFTNAMLTGLRGAADSSGDKKVTLNELYSYAFSETLAKTEKSSVGPQHPNYNITLVGSGDLVLSDISNSDCVLHLNSDLSGRVIIRNSSGKLISEINKIKGTPVFLALEEGNYNVTLSEKNITRQGHFSLTSGKVYELSSPSLYTVASSENRLRGPEEPTSAETDSDDENEDDDDDDNEEEPSFDSEDTVYMPFEFSIAANEITRHMHKKVITNFSLALFNSYVYEANGGMYSGISNNADIIHGFQAAGIFNVTKELHGMQAAGIFNTAHDVNGCQAAAIFNTAHNVTGCQAAAIFNTAEDVHGLQASAIFNTAHDFRGFQATAIFNSASKVTGCQASAVFNMADMIDGAQLAAVFNSADEVAGFQASAVVNYADRINKSGVQLGIINIAGEVEGLQIGLLNLSTNGIIEGCVSYTSNSNIRNFICSGQNRLYSVIGVSVPAKDYLLEKQYDLVNVFFGLGTRLQADAFNFDFELQTEEIFTKESIRKSDGKKHANPYIIPAMRLSAGWSPAKHIQIFAGGIFAFEFDANRAAFDVLTSNIVVGQKNCRIHPEFEFGIKYSVN